MNVIDRIQQLLIANHVPARSIRPTLARVCGISYAAVSQWFSGRTGSIRHENLLSIARAYGTTVDWLISGEGEMTAVSDAQDKALDTDQTEVRLTPIPLISVPLISWDAAWLRSKSDTFVSESMENMMPSPDNVGPRGFALVVEGEAMRNTNPNEDSYPHNTIIFVDPDLAPTIGAPVLVLQRGKKNPIFRILTRDGGQDMLKPLNSQFDLINLEEGDEIFGVIYGYYRRPVIA